MMLKINILLLLLVQVAFCAENLKDSEHLSTAKLSNAEQSTGDNLLEVGLIEDEPATDERGLSRARGADQRRENFT